MISRYGTTLLLAVWSCLAVSARAADPLPIAVLNMDRIFKTHQPLLDKLNPIKEAAQELEKTVQLRTVEIETVAAQLRKTPPNSAEFAKLQQQGVKLQTDLQQFVARERSELQKRETAVYVTFYRGLEQEVRKYAQAHGLKLVIRQQESTLDENQPLPEILKALNRQIIYEDGLDITDAILKALDARSGAKAER